MNILNVLFVLFLMFISLLMGFSMGKYHQLREDVFNRIDNKIKELDSKLLELKGN